MKETENKTSLEERKVTHKKKIWKSERKRNCIEIWNTYEKTKTKDLSSLKKFSSVYISSYSFSLLFFSAMTVLVLIYAVKFYVLFFRDWEKSS